jgi:hypothetical protein
LKLRSAAYDPAARRVTIRPAGRIALNQPLRLIIADGAGLRDLAGNRLDGNHDGTAGGDYFGPFGKRARGRAVSALAVDELSTQGHLSARKPRMRQKP